jgi:hypothetical protein
MKPDNSSYTVTAPDLFLADAGLSVVITSTNNDLVDGIKLLFEKYVINSIVFNVQDKTTNGTTLPWLWHVSRTCEYMIVDIDTCAWEDIMAALLKTTDDMHVVIFYSEKRKRREAIRLINATSKYIIFNSLEDLDKFLDIETNTGMS